MKHGLQEGGIHEHRLLDELAKNRILHVLLFDTKERRVGCFGAVFIAIHKGLAYSRKRIRVQ